MLKVKLKDLELAMEYMKHHAYSEFIEFDGSEVGGSALSLSFIDKNSKACKIFLYESGRNITPELKTTTKLYKQEK